MGLQEEWRAGREGGRRTENKREEIIDLDFFFYNRGMLSEYAQQLSQKNQGYF